MIVILSGAKKNLGDYLIVDRAKALLKAHVDNDIVQLNRFEKLDQHLDLINKSRALILCGGPAYAYNIYKGIYPLVDDISKIKAPIIPFGLGWSGAPFQDPTAFRFDEGSEEFLKTTHQTIETSSCRDVITESILNNNGIDNVTMTGCPVWYDMEFVSKPFRKAEEPKNIVFSTGASSNLILQTIRLIRLTKNTFPKATIHLTYHRGILPGKHTPPRKGLSYTLIAFVGKLLGCKIYDVSGDLKKIEFYDDCDFHIGYRVHAHLYFLSKRIPSVLINEDGRGLGMVRSMSLPELNYNDKNLVNKMSKVLQGYKNSNFSDFDRIQHYIDDKYQVMKSFLKSIG